MDRSVRAARYGPFAYRTGAQSAACATLTKVCSGFRGFMRADRQAHRAEYQRRKELILMVGMLHVSYEIDRDRGGHFHGRDNLKAT